MKINLSWFKVDSSRDEEYEGLNSWRTYYPSQHLDKKWCSCEWRRWWSWRLKKESTHQTNKYKYSIVISWYFFGCALVYIQLMCYSCLSVSIYTTELHIWCFTTLHFYISILKPLFWHIRSNEYIVAGEYMWREEPV